MPSLRVFAIDVETKIANLFLSVPFEQHATVLADLRAEQRQLHGGNRLNRGIRLGRIIRRIGIAGRRSNRSDVANTVGNAIDGVARRPRPTEGGGVGINSDYHRGANTESSQCATDSAAGLRTATLR